MHGHVCACVGVRERNVDCSEWISTIASPFQIHGFHFPYPVSSTAYRLVSRVALFFQGARG